MEGELYDGCVILGILKSRIEDNIRLSESVSVFEPRDSISD